MSDEEFWTVTLMIFNLITWTHNICMLVPR